MFDDSGNSMQIFNFCRTKHFTSEKLWKTGKWLVCVFKSTITASNFLFLAHPYAELWAADKNDPTPTQTLKSLGLIGLKCCFRRKTPKCFFQGSFIHVLYMKWFSKCLNSGNAPCTKTLLVTPLRMYQKNCWD